MEQGGGGSGQETSSGCLACLRLSWEQREESRGEEGGGAEKDTTAIRRRCLDDWHSSACPPVDEREARFKQGLLLLLLVLPPLLLVLVLLPPAVLKPQPVWLPALLQCAVLLRGASSSAGREGGRLLACTCVCLAPLHEVVAMERQRRLTAVRGLSGRSRGGQGAVGRAGAPSLQPPGDSTAVRSARLACWVGTPPAVWQAVALVGLASQRGGRQSAPPGCTALQRSASPS